MFDMLSFDLMEDLIWMEVLGRFIRSWLERAEVEEREGMVSEGRYAQALSLLHISSSY
ncbi:hypothetical protein M378DRAFT_172523 [Amanita muscaria Koide BX008]|uniref:Uncharacterized protein n=1 Tax=Amanita muscaria (strain Koide BX008) TaxID=946122 RepID=A0A0C2S1W4_AMAMK|nr:hypothetical protein M378DRAFT_172523 [Amanita muscaria Koide BX008]